MSERTTIGGVSYESVGSSSSNLLLKSNGTVRVQWGGKLIDLIKNGKIASGESSIKLEVINDISEIKSDGVYVLSQDESLQLLICKDDEQYNITQADLYISAKTKQDITVEQKQQALENIGMYYNTLEEVQKAGLQNGLVYVLSDQTLYVIRDGVITEFEAKLKTVTVTKEQQEGEIIKSDVSIVLSVLETDYVVVGNGQVVINYPLYLKESAYITSENADQNHGYRLYIDSTGSHLDVDYINVRTGLQNTDYIETTYDEFSRLIANASLSAHKWYLIVDYKNPWQCHKRAVSARPILVQALTGASLYPEGKLFKDQRVKITYNPSFKRLVNLDVVENKDTGEMETGTTTTPGLITKMTDANNNTANFDFLDYGVDEDPEIILHASIEDASLDSSIFPIGSFNNTLTVTDLKGTVLDDSGNLGGTSRINFKFEDVIPTQEEEIPEPDETQDFVEEEIPEEERIPNTEEEGEGEGEGEEGIDSSDTLVCMVMHDNIINCNGIIVENSCKNFYNNVINGLTSETPIKTDIVNSTFSIVHDSENPNLTTIDCHFKDVTFKEITGCQFKSSNNSVDTISDTTCYIDIRNLIITPEEYPLLYESGKSKEIYTIDANKLQITTSKEQTFFRGMIVMHAGNAPIPEGWGICDGRIEEYNGEKIQTPNLVGNFIKAVGEGKCGPGGNSEITISVENLPEHTHTYEILTEDSKNLNIHEGDDVLPTSIPQYTTKSTQTEATGSGKAITIDPQHYGLIFIMKL